MDVLRLSQAVERRARRESDRRHRGPQRTSRVGLAASNLSEAEAIELGSKVAALVGLGIEGEEGMAAGAVAGAEAAAEVGVHPISDDEQLWDVLEEIPNDSAAVLILLEHHWAVPLRDAIARAGGFRIGDGFISPADLVEIGLMSREDAHSMEAVAQPIAAPAHK